MSTLARRKCVISLCTCGALDSATRRRSTAAFGVKAVKIARPFKQVIVYLAEAIFVTVVGIARIMSAKINGGDVYDAKVILASDFSDLGAHRLAIAWLNRIIRADPRRPRAYFERGMAYLELKNGLAGKKDFEECLKLDPAFPGARHWHARTVE